MLILYYRVDSMENSEKEKRKVFLVCVVECHEPIMVVGVPMTTNQSG